MEDIINIVKLLEDSGLLIKPVSETIQNDIKGQREGFLSMLLGILGASLLGNMLAGNGMKRAGEGFLLSGYGSKRSSIKDFLMLPHPLTNFKIQKYYQNEPRFN